MNPQIKILGNANELARTAAIELARVATEAVKARSLFTLALSGGSTPEALYSLLASEEPWRSELPWHQMHFFWGDERHVPPDHPDSNYGMVEAALFSRVAIPPANLHRIRGEESDPQTAAEEYEQALKEFFHPLENQLPRFDLVLLGLGDDGHTASLFPGSAALGANERWVAANWIEKFKAWRLTLTLPVLNHAAHIMFLVSGQKKADILRAVLEEPRGVYPAQLIQPTNGELLWMIDSDAAAALSRTRTVG